MYRKWLIAEKKCDIIEVSKETVVKNDREREVVLIWEYVVLFMLDVLTAKKFKECLMRC